MRRMSRFTRYKITRDGKEFSLPSGKKEREALPLAALSIVSKGGDILSSNLAPKYEGLTMDDMEGIVPYVEVMSAYEYADLDNKELRQILRGELTVAEKKIDGHRGVTYLPEGARLFSKRISKTGWFTENSDQMPHLRDIKVPPHLLGSVVDGEVGLIHDFFESKDVQSITGSKPVNALAAQVGETGPAVLNIFDVVYYGETRVASCPGWVRKIFAFSLVSKLDNPYIVFSPLYATPMAKIALLQRVVDFNNKYMILSQTELKAFEAGIVCTKDYSQLFQTMLAEGSEGIMVKDLTLPYVEKESKAYIKMKGKATFDVIVTGTEPPTKEYTSEKRNEDSSEWDFWEDKLKRKIQKTLTMEEGRNKKLTPISKPYFNGWIGAITYGVMREGKLIEVGRTSGMTDYDRERLTALGKKIVGKVIEVEAQGIIDPLRGTLRHPRYIQDREDKNAKDCTWERHLRK